MIPFKEEELIGNYGMTFRTWEVGGLIPAIHGMRNPKDSWEHSDSYLEDFTNEFKIGEKDLCLAQSLISGGPCHSKFLRQIMVWVEITGPLYFWTELDTYKVATVRNSCSTMHKLVSKIKSTPPEDLKDCKIKELFCAEDPLVLEHIRKTWALMYEYYNNSLEDEVVKLRKLKQLLPDSYRMRSMYTCSYATIRNINKWRSTHRLPEWRKDWIKWVHTLPYADELIFYKGEMA